MDGPGILGVKEGAGGHEGDRSGFSLSVRCESSMKNTRVLMASSWRLVAVLGLLIAPGAPLAFAAGPIPAADGVIHGCHNNATGVLRVVSDASQCLSSTNALVQRNAALLETPLAWNQAGPQGPKGDTGSRYSVTSACPPPPFGVPVGTPIPYGPLAPGSSCTIDVTYTATTGTAPTRVLGSLAIASNAINGVVNVAILATGDPATCQGRPSCLQP
jgi:hypothetical protein